MPVKKYIKDLHWLLLGVGIILIIVHGFWPDVFIVDWVSILILFILFIPIVAQYLNKAKFPGAEFEFKDEIRETEVLVSKSIQETEKKQTTKTKSPIAFETFNLSGIREMVGSDPNLALAALRIEIEKKFKLLSEMLKMPISETRSFSKVLDYMKTRQLLSLEQREALKKIIYMCNKAIHGSSVTVKEAKEIVQLAENLNKTFAVGYSINFAPNPDFEKYGLVCEWEHCIEWMPLTDPTELSCPVFGHNCPGGLKKVSKCLKKIADIPNNRFVKK